MQKLKIFNSIIFGLAYFYIDANAQGVLGDLIDKAKSNATPSIQIKSSVLPQYRKIDSDPKIWSITGVNAQYTLEWLYENNIYSIKAFPDQVLPGSWTVLNITDDLLQVRRGSRVLNLKPSRLGGSVAEFFKDRNIQPQSPISGPISLMPSLGINTPSSISTGTESSNQTTLGSTPTPSTPQPRPIQPRNGG